jgi:hypothetical protein
MSRSRLLLIALIAGALMVAVVAMATYIQLTGRKARDVPVPAADASPADVVLAYTDALDAHDCDTVDALMTPGARGSSWCGDVDTLSDVRIGRRIRERPRDAGLPSGGQVVIVPVIFGLHWRPFHSDASLGEGTTHWGYSLVRSSPGDPWRIFDQGTG